MLLVEIPDRHLPKLALLYKEKAPWAPYMATFIHTAIKWKQSEKYRRLLTFMSPDNAWQENGTVISVLTCGRRDVLLFSLEDDCTILYQTLLQTDLFDSCNRVMIYGVLQKHLPAVRKYIEDENLIVINDEEYLMYGIEPEVARNFTLECPQGTYLEKLAPSAAKQADLVWPYRFPGSDKYLQSFIEMDGGYGLFLEPGGQLVSWVLWHVFGHMTMLQTEEGYKKKGFGSLVAKALAKEMAREGLWPMGCVLADNIGSVKVFEGAGFKSMGICHYIVIQKEM